jgi:hypothetical protein
VTREREGAAISRHERLKNTIADKKPVVERRKAGLVSANDVTIEPDVGRKIHAASWPDM